MFFGDIMLNNINKVVWLFVSSFVIFNGVFYTIYLKGIQLKFITMVKSVFKFNGDVSAFGILMTSLAGRIGVGSIAGVALSIYIGGIGSVFWLWVSTFLCAIITYCESFLGAKYKVNKEDGYHGGPAYYIRDGLSNRFLGNVYAILIIFCYIVCFLSIQSNTITRTLTDVTTISPFVVGICIVTITFFCICGGFKKIVSVSEKLVPIMTLVYVGSAFYVFLVNFYNVFDLFVSILKSAFNFKSFFSGFIPMFIIGIQRGIFSNEAGLGTSSIVASTSSSNDFKNQGMIQMFGCYITTLIICTSTVIILLCSNYNGVNLTDINGIELAISAFKYHFGNIGIYIMVISVLLFSFSTILTGYYYGESCLGYFFNKTNIKYIRLLRVVTLIILFFSCFISSSFLWGIVDIFVGITIIINLYGIWKLRKDLLN